MFPELLVQVPEVGLYKNDNVEVTVSSDGEAISDVHVMLDDSMKYKTDDMGVVTIYSISGGTHFLSVYKEGYSTALVNFSVYPTTYANSPEVKAQRTPEERKLAVSEGKVVLIFYDLPNCPNCVVMKQWVADIVNKNRECISYELLNIYYKEPKDELRELLSGQSDVSTPVIVVDGPEGGFMSTGFASKTSIEKKLAEAAGGSCEIKWT
ncbi:MAG: hypothetical protein V1703_02885 [Candidatus Altiarchaeota archaeon]